jgi:hypothetical protein
VQAHLEHSEMLPQSSLKQKCVSSKARPKQKKSKGVQHATFFGFVKEKLGVLTKV